MACPEQAADEVVEDVVVEDVANNIPREQDADEDVANVHALVLGMRVQMRSPTADNLCVRNDWAYGIFLNRAPIFELLSGVSRRNIFFDIPILDGIFF